jgi:hypothetical protein
MQWTMDPGTYTLKIGVNGNYSQLDARGLNRLQRTGTLPTVWIPPGEIRDHRELPRTRMVFANLRTRLKNRTHSVFDKYGLHTDFDGMSDIFGRLPEETHVALTAKR